MPIRNQIEAVCRGLTAAPQFVCGTQKELNLLADDQQFPCVFMHPLQAIVIDPKNNGSVDNTFTLYLEFLYQTEFGQYTADNETYVNHALQMANEFIVKASGYREGEGRYFKIKTGEKAKCVPVYNKYDVNTTGVGLTLTLNTMYFEFYPPTP